MATAPSIASLHPRPEERAHRAPWGRTLCKYPSLLLINKSLVLDLIHVLLLAAAHGGEAAPRTLSPTAPEAQHSCTAPPASPSPSAALQWQRCHPPHAAPREALQDGGFQQPSMQAVLGVPISHLPPMGRPRPDPHPWGSGEPGCAACLRSGLEP